VKTPDNIISPTAYLQWLEEQAVHRSQSYGSLHESDWGCLGEAIFTSGGVTDWVTEKVFQASRSTAFPHPEEIPVGVIPLFEQNAFAIRPPCGGAVVCMDLHLGLVLYHLCAAFMQFCRTGDRGFQCDVVGFAMSSHVADVNTMTLKAMTVDKVVSNPEDDQDFNLSLSLLQLWLVTLVFLHEFAHCCLGHLNDSAVTTRHLPLGDGLDVETHSHMRKQEMEADAQAIRWLICLTREHTYASIEVVPCVCYLLFGYFWVIDHLFPIAKTERRTHPHAGERFFAAMDILKREGCLGDKWSFPEYWLTFYYPILKAIESGEIKQWDLPKLYWA